MGGARSAYRGGERVLVGKPEGKRPLGKLRRRWEDNIRMDLQEVGCGGNGLDLSGSEYGQMVGNCRRVSQYTGSFVTSREPVAAQKGLAPRSK
jgi:hypothetical protein